MAEAAAHPLPTGQRLIVTVGIMAAVLLQVLDTTIANVALPHMQASLSATQDTINWVLTSYIIASAIALPMSGWLADRVGRKVVIVPSTVLTGLSMVLFCYAPSYAWFVAACIVWSIAASISSSAPAAYVVDTAPAGMNASAMTAFRMTADAGYVLGPPGLGLLADVTSAAVAIISASIVLVCIGALFAITPPDRRSWQQV